MPLVPCSIIFWPVSVLSLIINTSDLYLLLSNLYSNISLVCFYTITFPSFMTWKDKVECRILIYHVVLQSSITQREIRKIYFVSGVFFCFLIFMLGF